MSPCFAQEKRSFSFTPGFSRVIESDRRRGNRLCQKLVEQLTGSVNAGNADVPVRTACGSTLKSLKGSEPPTKIRAARSVRTRTSALPAIGCSFQMRTTFCAKPCHRIRSISHRDDQRTFIG